MRKYLPELHVILICIPNLPLNEAFEDLTSLAEVT